MLSLEISSIECYANSDRSIWMYQDFRISFHPLIEFLVRSGRVVDPNLVADNKTWICFAGDDHIAKITIVLLNVALPCAE